MNILIPSTKHLTIFKCEKCLSQKVVSVTGGNNNYRETIIEPILADEKCQIDQI